MRAGACHDRPWLVTTTTIAAAASRPPPLSTCTQAAAVHGTMHKLEDLGIVTSGARSRGFDGKVGLAQSFTNATKPLHTYPRAGRATYLVVPKMEGARR